MTFESLFSAVLFLWYFTGFAFAAGGKYNITYESKNDFFFAVLWCIIIGVYQFTSALDRCKEYDAINGYNYRTYFHLSDLKHSSPKDEELININLIVLGSKDAHILLTSTTDPDISESVYEIVLGAGGNTFCEIRKKRKASALKNKRVQVLSSIDPVPIKIRITRCKCYFLSASVRYVN